MKSVKSPEGFQDRCHMSWFTILKHCWIHNVWMLADQLRGKDTLLLFSVKIELLRLPCSSCGDQVTLRWCSLSVLNLANNLSFESREEGAGGDVPLQNLESMSAVHILNPLSIWHMTFKEFLSRVQIRNASLYANNASKQLIFPFCLRLQKTAMPSETVALSVAPPQRFWVWSPLAPPTCPVTARNCWLAE
jgi:hypothetical protein